MDTHESVPPHDLSEIFSILEGDPAGIHIYTWAVVYCMCMQHV